MTTIQTEVTSEAINEYIASLDIRRAHAMGTRAKQEIKLIAARELFDARHGNEHNTPDFCINYVLYASGTLELWLGQEIYEISPDGSVKGGY